MKGDAMKLLRRLLVIAVSMLACGLWASGQNPLACSAAQIAAGPCIDKIDPPGWWAGLPDPMLLGSWRGTEPRALHIERQGRDSGQDPGFGKRPLGLSVASNQIRRATNLVDYRPQRQRPVAPILCVGRALAPDRWPQRLLFCRCALSDHDRPLCRRKRGQRSLR